MSSVKISTIDILLLKAANKANLTLESSSLGKLCEAILRGNPNSVEEPISKRYISEQLMQKIRNLNGEGTIEIRKLDYLDQIAQFLGYASFNSFDRELSKPLSDSLKSCVGLWYYYVRESSGKDVILRSPVEISFHEKSREMNVRLFGRDRRFEGTLAIRAEALFILLNEVNGEKELHLVFKIGLFKNPELLEGVFSGYSSYGKPVAGRVFLLRQDHLSLDEMSIKKWNLSQEELMAEVSEQAIISQLLTFKSSYIIADFI